MALPKSRLRRGCCCLVAIAAVLLAAGSQPAAASLRAALSIPQPASHEGETAREAYLPVDVKGLRAGESRLGDWMARGGDPARRGGDSESRSDSEGCDEAREVAPPGPVEEAEECSSSDVGCQNDGPVSRSKLHPAAQPWWGRIADAPTMAEFSFNSEVVARCANRRERVPMTKLPLSLPPNVYQQMLMSQATCTGRAYGEEAASGEQESWEEVCRMLPNNMADVMPQDSRYESCAVVGNSGNLLMTHYGAEIDLHDVIIRFNDAPTDGFEKHVGSKVDYRIMNKHRFHIYSHDGRSSNGGSVKSMPQDKHATVVASHVSPQLMAPDMHSALQVTQGHNLDINFTAMSNHVHEYTNQAMRAFAHCLEIRSKKARVSKVTSGMKAILTAMHMCKRVSVYGVGDTSLSDNSVPYQYFTQSGEWSGRDEVSPHHNLSLEEAFLHALARANLIRHCRYKGCQGSHVHPSLS